MENVQWFVECGAELDGQKKYFRRKYYCHPQQVDHFRAMFNNTGVYQTVMMYMNPVWFQNEKGQWIINAQESYKYGPFYLDFDSHLVTDQDFEKVKEDVRKAIRYLKAIMSVDPTCIQLFYSGYKGIHLIVPPEYLGIHPHQALNQIYKDLAKDIEQYCQNGTLDIKIYDDKRMWRMVNSIHKKTGLYKIPITLEEFQNLGLDEIRKLARMPRQIHQPAPKTSHKTMHAFERYIRKWNEKSSIRTQFNRPFKEIKEYPPCIKAMLSKSFRETIDKRNNSATALTSFFMQQGIDREEALERILKWNEENCLPPLPFREIKATVHSVYNGKYRYGCETFKELSGVCDKNHCPLFQ